MKTKQIYRLSKEIWFSELGPRGFSKRNGRYLRNLDSGVIHLIGMAKDPHGAETFLVMCGVDAIQLREITGEECGYSKKDGLHHLIPGGWDYNSGRWPCETEEEARASLTALLPLILELAIPYFDPITTLSHVGDEINEVRMPHLGWMKARLYLLDGDIPRARAAIDNYAAYAATPKSFLPTEDIEQDIQRAGRIRQEIELAAKSTQ